MALSRGSKWFLGFLFVGLLAVGGGVLWLNDLLPQPDEVAAGEPIDFTVERGESVRSVGDRLAELGVVRNSTTFRIAAGDANLAGRLQPGSYELETGMGSQAAIEILLAGPEGGTSIRFTVQEGLTVEQTLARLDAQFDDHAEADFRAVLDERTSAGENAEGVLQLPDWVPEPAEVSDDVREPYEGLLFPETYEVRIDASPLEVLQRMIDQLERVMNDVPAERVAEAEERGQGRFDMLTIASLIERETRVDAERDMVAGVIANRIDEGMRLQIDATALYAAGEHRGIVTIADTELEHPYNTYRIDGLPPGPISGAGRASISAAFAPADVSYLFYVLSPECDGSHDFADTLDEHNRNVQAFRNAGRCQDEDVPEPSE